MSLPPLTVDQQVKPRQFEVRVSLMFFAMFIPAGVHVPYFPLWLEAEGFDAEQIAIVLSAPVLLRLIATPYITALADRASDRANVLIAVMAATLVLSAGYFLPPTYAIVVAVSVLIHIFWAAHSPLTDSIALSGVRRFGSNYPAMRLWGSIAFMLGSFGGGLILAQTGPGAVPTILFVGFCGGLAATFLVPRLGRPRRPSPLSATGIQSAPALLNRHFVMLVVAAGVINATHAFLFAFGAIYWKSIGIPEDIQGGLWSFAVLAEIGMFVIFTRVLGRASHATVLALAGAGAVVRWLAFPLIDPYGFGIPGFFAVQSLHSISTALILIGVQKLIAESVDESRTGAAQGAAFVANGASWGLVTFASGPLYEHFGVDGFYAMAGVALAGTALVFLAGQPQKAGSGG
jgi:PPP family 3-phenylpropionic acid transporter